MMMKQLSLAVAAAALAAGIAVQPASAEPNPGVRAGILTCNVDSGWGFVFGSTRDLKCTFSHDNGPIEQYTGHINKFGVDVGYMAGGVIVWAVVAPTSNVGHGSLEGEYGGVTGSAAVGVGVGGNVLVGGLEESFALQPLSIEGTSGLNVAAGISQVSLKFVKN